MIHLGKSIDRSVEYMKRNQRRYENIWRSNISIGHSNLTEPEYLEIQLRIHKYMYFLIYEGNKQQTSAHK